MPDDTDAYLFLTGSDMDPTEVRKAFPDAQFVARGYTEAHAGAISATFADVVATPGVGDVWGILLRVPEPIEGDFARYDVTTDDGRTFNAAAIGDKLVSGQSNETLAAARYWELPTGYTGRLKMATPALGKAGSDDDE
jgi:hypothetical protein